MNADDEALAQPRKNVHLNSEREVEKKDGGHFSFLNIFMFCVCSKLCGTLSHSHVSGDNQSHDQDDVKLTILVNNISILVVRSSVTSCVPLV